MEILVIISIVLYTVYLSISGANFNVTSSLSETHYRWVEKLPTGIIFTLFCWVIAFTTMIPMLVYSPSMYTSLAFLSGAGLLLVGASVWFKDNKLENRVHVTGAIMSGVFSYLWALIVGNIPLTILALVATIILIIFRKKIKLVYWIELVAFINIYIQLILKIWS